MIAFVLVAVLALIFLPGMWIKYVMKRYAVDRPDYPGTGGELARHLLDRADLDHVKVEISPAGDHYDPTDKAVRLSAANHDGRSLTAVAVAAHEVAHAMQDASGYGPLIWRTRMARSVHTIQRIGSGILLATPLIGLLTRAPSIILLEIGAGIAFMATSVVAHAVTLPVELDASFNRALPILESGDYLDEQDFPAARKVLKAAAYTYVSAALMSLLDVMSWLRILR